MIDQKFKGIMQSDMYAGVNPKFRELLGMEKSKKIRLLEEADVEYLCKVGL